ncbi:MAG: hypothetical protein GY814_01305 [Gammaproteobacteria bacterium]|nr:hypothetical protein [Gammaproteobacteria bacterium]
MHTFKQRAIYLNQEFQSAIVRLGIWAFAIVYVSAGLWSERYPVDITHFVVLFVVYLLLFFGILISIFIRPVWDDRRYFSLVVDISATTLCLYLTGEAASPFFLLYIWIFVSYGTRYGRRLLMVASMLSVVAYSIVLTFLDQWDRYFFEALFVLFVLGLLPTYQYSLINKLRLARVQAEESSRLMGRFLSNITNDMRAPLGDIITISNDLAGSGLNMRQADRVEEVISSALLLDAAIGDVLDFSKIEAQQLQIQSVPFDLKDLLLEVCSAISQSAVIKKIELICSVSNEVPEVIVGDEQRLRQILVNVIKYALGSFSEGELRVGVMVDADATDVLVFVMDRQALLPLGEASEVSNNRFFSDDLEIGAKESGPDLGLSLARKLAMIMGGEFRVVRSKDSSLFQLKLPVVANEFVTERVSRTSFLQGKKVFLFETSDYSREIITKFCEDAGMIVESVGRVAALGDAVLESKGRGDIDLILISDPPEGKDVARIASICLSALGQDLPLVILAYRSNGLDLDTYSSATLIRKPLMLNCVVDSIYGALVDDVIKKVR